MNAKPHGINFTDADWETIKRIASEVNMTPAALVNDMCREFAVHQYGYDWQGLKPRGWNRYSEKAVKNDTPDKLGGLTRYAYHDILYFMVKH